VTHNAKRLVFTNDFENPINDLRITFHGSNFGGTACCFRGAGWQPAVSPAGSRQARMVRRLPTCNTADCQSAPPGALEFAKFMEASWFKTG
jgi:hypothetical protein